MGRAHPRMPFVMYIPAYFEPDPETVTDLLNHHGAGDLITVTEAGLLATMLPFLFDPPASRPDAGPLGSLVGHVARNNGQWRTPAQGLSLAILRGPDAYISPSWYQTKREHGRVVPTWNYLTAHVYGELVIHDNVAWLEALVRRLTDKHEIEPPSAVVGRRCAPGLRRRTAQGDRRDRAPDRADRGQGQAQPEPLRGGHHRRDRGPRRDRSGRPRPGNAKGAPLAGHLTGRVAAMAPGRLRPA